MKVKYRCLTAAMTVCFLLSFTSIALAIGVTDIDGHWAQDRIGKWTGDGLVAGYPDGSFKPDQGISRAEFVTLVNRAFKKQNGESSCNFSDVKPSDWFYREVASAGTAGYVSGYPDGTFRPEQAITRQEAAVMATGLMNLTTGNKEISGFFKDEANFPAWARGSIEAVAAGKIMKGYPDGTFRPKNLITRAEALVTLDNALSMQTAPQEPELKGTVAINGQPVQGAQVKLFAAKGREVLQETVTGRDGSYRFIVQEGSYDLLAEDENTNVGYAGNVNITAGTSAFTELALTRGFRVHGRLLDKNGQALAAVKVIFTANPTNVGITDSKGRFSVVLPVTGNDGQSLVYSGFYEYKGVSHEFLTDRRFSGDIDLGDVRTTVVTGSTGGGGGGSGGGGTSSGDTTPPVWAIDYPKTTNITETGVDILLQSNEAGKAYYVALASGGAAPIATEVKNGTGSGGSVVVKSGHVTLTANTEVTATISGLAASTSYDIYVVAEDTVSNLQLTPSKVVATTAAALPGDTTPPVLSSASVKSAVLALTYNEPLDAGSVPAGGDFTVKVNGEKKDIKNVSITDNTVILTLAAVGTGDTVAVNYTPGENPIRDPAGNNAASLVNQSVTNNTVGEVITPPGYNTPPVLQTAGVDNVTLTLFYNEYLDTSSVPANDDFTVSVNGTARPLTYISITGSTVILVLETPVQTGDSVTVSYTPGANPIRDREGNTSGVFSGITATNTTEALPAPELDRTVATSFAESTAFLYTGGNPIQTGVAPDTIEPEKAAVLRGKVLTRDGMPISGVKVTILGLSDFGNTLTRADGMFDLATNGGTSIAVNYVKDGYLTVQRHVDVPLQNYVWLPDVVMIECDNKVTAIKLDGGPGMQVAQGSPVTDADGTRQATLLFPEGTSAEMVLPDGSTQDLSSLNVRLTEYTVGDNGPEAMPGELPEPVGYTYALEYTVDEAVAAGADNVRFNRPVYHYNENFLNFPVGGIVPVGYYDRDRGAWISTENGRIVQILRINEDGLAELDVDGSGTPAGAPALADLGIDQAEQLKLAGLYEPGQSFWRVPIRHFTPYDYNWPVVPPEDAKPPEVKPPEDEPGEEEPCEGAGSIIEYQNQVLGEIAKVFGTPFQLNYRSSRVLGNKNQINIPLSGDSLPASLKTVKLEIVWMGKRFTMDFTEPGPHSWYKFLVDQKDAYGRQIQGGQMAGIKIGYTYDGVYQEPSAVPNSFGQPGGVPISVEPSREEVTLWQSFNVPVGSWDAQPLGLGGWTLDVHQTYDPVTNTLYLGDGSFRKLPGQVRGQSGAAGAALGSSVISTVEQVNLPAFDVAVAPDNSLYVPVSMLQAIFKIKDGVGTIVAGSLTADPQDFSNSGDGGPATEAKINGAMHIVVGPDGSFYFNDMINCVVRKVDKDGIITTVAGAGKDGDYLSENVGDVGEEGSSGLATEATLLVPCGLALGPDGSLYIADLGHHRVRRVDPAGFITTVAGNGDWGQDPDEDEDGIPAVEARLDNPRLIALGPDGSLYIGEELRIRKVDSQGIITTVAGGEISGFTGDGGPALGATFEMIMGLAVGPDGSLYVSDLNRIRRIGLDGVINTMVGTGEAGYSGDGGPPSQAQLFTPMGMDFGPDGSLYIADCGNLRIRKVASGTPGMAITDNVIPSKDGQEVYIFDGDGWHLRTVHPLTGAAIYLFAYDAAGRLQSITDGDGNVTEIQRNAAGEPTAIVAPGGQITGLRVNDKGFLSAIICPLDYERRLEYAGDADPEWSCQDGLLTKLTDHKDNVYSFTYDENNKLILDQDPAGGSTSLLRTELDNGYQVAATTGLGRVSTYRVQRLPTGGQTRINTLANGGQIVVNVDTNGKRTINYADGTKVEVIENGDPRWGKMVPQQDITVTTPDGLAYTITETGSVEPLTPGDPINVKTVTGTVTAGGNPYSGTYDADTGMITFTTPEGRQVVYTIDTQGRVVKEETTGYQPIEYIYNNKGKLVTKRQGSRSWQYDYNDKGNLVKVTDSLGQITEYVYNGAGLLINETRPGNREILYSYDKNGNTASITPPGRSPHTFNHTPVNLVESYGPPGGGSQTFEYNKDRQLVRMELGGQSSVSYNYDSSGKLTGVTFPGDNIRYEYNSAGRLKTISTDGVTESFSYDGFLLTDATVTGSVYGTINWNYNNNLDISDMTINGQRVEFNRDRDGLLTKVGDLEINRKSQNNDIAGTKLNGVITTQSSNGFGEKESFGAEFNNNLLYEVQYTRDNLGRITGKNETVIGDVYGESNSNSYIYSYDTDGRLAEVRLNGVPVAVYSYDGNGNRLNCTGPGGTVNASYDAQDRLVQYGSTIYSFNADGSLQSKVDDNNRTTTYDYDVFGGLRSATLPDGTVIDYIIDGKDRRVGKKVNGALMQGFLYEDDLRPVVELDGGNNIISSLSTEQKTMYLTTWKRTAIPTVSSPITWAAPGWLSIPLREPCTSGWTMTRSATSSWILTRAFSLSVLPAGFMTVIPN